MAPIFGFEPPDYGLIESNPLQFKEDFQSFVASLTAAQAGQGDLETVRSQLTAALADRDQTAAAMQELQQQHTQATDAAAAAQTAHNIALAAYRQAMLNGDPSIPPELVQGETLEEVNANIEKAKGVVDYVRQKLVGSPGGAGVPGQTAIAPAPPPRIPAGAPGRTLPDLSGMSARDKLIFGTSRMAS